MSVLQSLGEFLTSWKGALTLATGIALWALIGYFRYFRRSCRKLRGELDFALGHLNQVSDPGQFKELYETIAESIERVEVLRKPWRRFREFLQPRSQEAGSPILYRMEDPELFFNDQTITAARINVAFYRAFPNILTGAGILGTFIGLAIGLGLTSGGLTSDDPKQVVSSLSSLLGGASVAFITSIAGLVCSILFTWKEKKHYHALNLKLDEWNGRLRELTGEVTLEALVDQSVSQAGKQLEAAQSFQTDLRTVIEQVIQEQMTQPLLGGFQSVVEGLNSIRGQLEKSTTEEWSRIGREVTESLRVGARAQTDSMIDTLQAMNKVAVDFIKKSQAAQEESQGVLLSSVEASSNAIRESSDAMAAEQRSLLVELRETWGDVLKGLGESVEGFRSAFREAGEAFREKLEECAASISGKLADAGESFGQSLEQANSSLSEVCREISALEQRILGSLAAFAQSTERLEKVCSLLGAHGEVWEDNVTSLRESASRLSLLSENMVVSVRDMEKTSTAIRATVSTLQEAGEETRGQWDRYVERFEGADEDLAGVMQQINDGLENYTGRISNFHQELDQNVARVLRNFTGSIQEFGNSIADLEEALSKDGGHG